jgi:hypothetical protein
MEGRYSIEYIEMQCAADCDGNAQVTTPVEIEEVISTKVETTKEEIDMERDFEEQNISAYTSRGGIVYVRTTDAATHWLLVAILAMMFLFMIFKCD